MSLRHAALAGLVALAACADPAPPEPIRLSGLADHAALAVTDYPAVRDMAEQGPPYTRALRREYLELSGTRRSPLSLYARKAVAAAEGLDVQPSQPGPDLQPATRADLEDARARLLRVTDPRRRGAAPEAAASAQAAYDCWLYETASGEVDAAAACRLRFEAALERAIMLEEHRDAAAAADEVVVSPP